MIRVFLACIASASILFCVSAERSEAQTCTNVPSGGGDTVEGFVTKADNSCTVAPGTYIVTTKGYRIDEHATAQGMCTLQALQCSPMPCTCVTTGTQLRGVAGMHIDQVSGGPAPPYSLGNIWPVDANGHVSVSQDADSRASGTTTSAVAWTPFYEGETTLRFKNAINTTNCNILPNEITTDFTIYSVKCAPRFKTDASTGIPDHLDVGTTSFISLHL